MIVFLNYNMWPHLFESLLYVEPICRSYNLNLNWVSRGHISSGEIYLGTYLVRLKCGPIFRNHSYIDVVLIIIIRYKHHVILTLHCLKGHLPNILLTSHFTFSFYFFNFVPRPRCLKPNSGHTRRKCYFF